MTAEGFLRFTTCASLLSACLAAASVTACERPGADAVAPLSVSLAQFQQLRWLTGSWRGTGGGVDVFFEAYRWVDDSTVRKWGGRGITNREAALIWR